MTCRRLLFIICFAFPLFSIAQSQNIKGIITTADTQLPIGFANVILLDNNLNLGTTSNEDGTFIIKDVPIGRYDVQASFVGYASSIIKDVIVSSSKEIYLEFKLEEIFTTLGEVVIKPNIDKEQALNNMALVSARMLSTEEANRYAGGFDDPARLASSFAGVSSGVNNNGIVVRGNAPKSMQWKLEGIEIPNPNHFANLVGIGGGALTALSSQLLANSDFLTGAFPSEYSNALSGVFDIKMRKGNYDKAEHTFQLGALGIDLSSEGPFKKGKKSSYLFNYRYSTFGLVGQITGAEEGIQYQDLSFKLNFPTKKAGVFSIWGIGLLDGIIVSEELDSLQWKYKSDKERYDANLYMGAAGINHRIILNEKSYIQSSLGFTASNTDWKINELDKNLVLKPKSNVLTTNTSFVFKTMLNTKFNKMHSNRSGFTITNLGYNTLIQSKIGLEESLIDLVDEKGSSYLMNAYTSSNFRLNQKTTLNLGLNWQLFTLGNQYTIEPRIAIRRDIDINQSIGFAYGLHSRLESLIYYFSKNPVTFEPQNTNLDFAKSHHFVISYSRKLSKNWLFKAEPYFQWLYDVPIIAGSYYSTLNQADQDDWFVNDKFVNEGVGRNYGIDLTLEKYLSNGLYMLSTISLFNSEYKGGDQIWRNTRFNKRFIINYLIGKEWYLGDRKNRSLGFNIRLTTQGGDWYIPFLPDISRENQRVILDEENAFSEKFSSDLIVHWSLLYKINKTKTTHTFGLNVINSTGYGDFQGFEYNLQTREIDETSEVIVIPNLSYKISF